MRRTLLTLLLVMLIPTAGAGILVTYQPSSGTFDPVEVDVPWGQLQDGTTIGANNSTTNVPVDGTLTLSSTDILYANNTNPDTGLYLRLSLVNITGLDLVSLLEIGIDNGTQTDQITIETGIITQETGALVHVPSGSTNTIYIDQSLDLLSSTVEITFEMVIADDTDETAYATTTANLTLE